MEYVSPIGAGAIYVLVSEYDSVCMGGIPVWHVSHQPSNATAQPQSCYNIKINVYFIIEHYWEFLMAVKASIRKCGTALRKWAYVNRVRKSFAEASTRASLCHCWWATAGTHTFMAFTNNTNTCRVFRWSVQTSLRFGFSCFSFKCIVLLHV